MPPERLALRRTLNPRNQESIELTGSSYFTFLETVERGSRLPGAVELVVGGKEREPAGNGVGEHLQRGDRRLDPVVEVSEPEHHIVVLDKRKEAFSKNKKGRGRGHEFAQVDVCFSEVLRSTSSLYR